MALLQISDPSDRPRPIGIDLGTTHSLVAWVSAFGEPTALRDCDDDPLVPSIVHYAADGGVIVGKPAAAKLLSAPTDTIKSVKRFMGRGAADPETMRLGPYRFATDEGPVVRFRVAGERVVTPVEVSAEILRTLRMDAEQALGRVGGAVITVPAYFDDAQRQATRDAARLAGLDVLRLLNEPTAAALAYGLDARTNGTFVVFDLGGGTFDVTLLELEDGVFQVRATGGDSALGGDDMDRVLAARVLRAFGRSTDERDPHWARFAVERARTIKHSLTEHSAVEADVEAPNGEHRVVAVRRDEFEADIGPLLDRIDAVCRRVLRDARLPAERVDGVILVGGATRVPAVRRRAEQLFGREPLAHIDPDQVVALGAAIQADLLAGESPRDDVLLLDVLPLSLGVEAMGGVVERILPRNTPIPAAASQVFTTYADQQTGFEIHVVQGERELAADCRSLARFLLRGIPPMPAGIARLEVSFRVDADGLLRVSARELTTGTEQHVEVRPSYGLTDDEMERMLLDAYEHGDADVKERGLREKRVEAERILAAVEPALLADAALLEVGEGERIAAAITALRAAMRDDVASTIDARIEALDGVSAAFAGRRMDRSIRAALAGQALERVEAETAHARGIEEHLEKAT